MALGGYRPGAGRKKGSVKTEPHRSARIVLSCTEDEAAKIKELAQKQNKNVTRFIIDSLLDASK